LLAAPKRNFRGRSQVDAYRGELFIGTQNGTGCIAEQCSYCSPLRIDRNEAIGNTAQSLG
jgi:hypothetical protein